MKDAINYFLMILVAAMLSALLGGCFAILVAGISPAFVDNLFFIKDGASLYSYSFAVGMIWGLFIGTAVGSFSCFLHTLYLIAKLVIDKKNDSR